MSDPAPVVPPGVQTLGFVWLVAGLINMMFGWVFGYAFWLLVTSIGGGLIATFCALVGCPCGLFAVFLPFCSLASLLIVPIGIMEVAVGIVALVQPTTVRPILPYVGLVGLLSFILGDFVTPIAALVSVFLLRDPEVREWLKT